MLKAESCVLRLYYSSNNRTRATQVSTLKKKSQLTFWITLLTFPGKMMASSCRKCSYKGRWIPSDFLLKPPIKLTEGKWETFISI